MACSTILAMAAAPAQAEEPPARRDLASAEPANPATDQTAAAEKERAERLQRVWNAVAKVGTTPALPAPERIRIVGKFISDFPVDNPHREMAEDYLGVLEAGEEPNRETLGAAKRAREDAQLENRTGVKLSDLKEAIERAEALIEEGEVADARELLLALRARHERSEAWPDYASWTNYLVGETYFAEEDFSRAAGAYNDARKNGPKEATWVPVSALRMGQCFERLGMTGDAKLLYDGVAEKYPRHPAGEEGRRLSRLLASPGVRR